MSSAHERALDEAERRLRAGAVVAAATDTLIGLLALPSQRSAIDALYELKERPAALPVALIASDARMAERFVDLGDGGRALASRHWPGPLTIVARARADLDERLQRDGRVGVRVPHPCDASRLAARLGECLTATSANRHGAPAPAETLALDPELRRALEAAGGVVLEGAGPGGLPSTIITCDGEILRPGAVQIDG